MKPIYKLAKRIKYLVRFMSKTFKFFNISKLQKKKRKRMLYIIYLDV